MSSLKQFQLFRSLTLHTLAEVNDENLDIQPKGHPNTIRWNAGHLYITAEFLLKKADSDYEIKRPEWAAFFAPGTRPSEWKTDPPAIQDIRSALEEQIDRIPQHFSEKLSNPAPETFVIQSYEMDTVDSLLNLVLYHEGVHSGTIKTLNNIIK
ncbi:DinB family protein [Bacillus norwichensis]|uniref:DinB family protein n=1 Tax=Bacillus norwichensis TaxID=2762217 RepID=A0ABR8VML7_9BACI|nr:DinB family protein [Bacillus norwichensis]MBD8006008.1 DinB family protein [Bacillus norwichensis]